MNLSCCPIIHFGVNSQTRNNKPDVVESKEKNATQISFKNIKTIGTRSLLGITPVCLVATTALKGINFYYWNNPYISITTSVAMGPLLRIMGKLGLPREVELKIYNFINRFSWLFLETLIQIELNTSNTDLMKEINSTLILAFAGNFLTSSILEAKILKDKEIIQHIVEFEEIKKEQEAKLLCGSPHNKKALIIKQMIKVTIAVSFLFLSYQDMVPDYDFFKEIGYFILGQAGGVTAYELFTKAIYHYHNYQLSLQKSSSAEQPNRLSRIVSKIAKISLKCIYISTIPARLIELPLLGNLIRLKNPISLIFAGGVGGALSRRVDREFAREVALFKPVPKRDSITYIDEEHLSDSFLTIGEETSLLPHPTEDFASPKGEVTISTLSLAHNNSIQGVQQEKKKWMHLTALKIDKFITSIYFALIFAWATYGIVVSQAPAKICLATFISTTILSFLFSRWANLKYTHIKDSKLVNESHLLFFRKPAVLAAILTYINMKLNDEEIDQDSFALLVIAIVAYFFLGVATGSNQAAQISDNRPTVAPVPPLTEIESSIAITNYYTNIATP